MSLKLDEFNQLLSTSKPVFVLVSANWCNPCRLVKPIFNRKAETEGHRGVFISIDADQSDDFCIEYSVNSIPHILVFKNGSLIDRTSGTNPELFSSFINKYLN